ncbi:DUF2269 family protein [Paenibacillus allorhizosphaerae]|uniref:DUF2269 family protein n=1 Tax=Paenibacillus allorhizosphaerae TaxID=2849866 RepID=A0ABM8VD69_9BACL|nr:DUF2269 family protein [Paenibacillus allorhizosphaerae]CAG7626466.1 hypothetical protein PAECIP111802_01253 [Paenibacillus allorhizosphaerae]
MSFWLFLHVLGVILFVGNIMTAAFWKVRADIGGNAEVIHSAAKNVMLADYCFTLPGLLLIIVSGNVMAVQAGHSFSGFNWLTSSLFLFAITGIIWLAVLIPLQRRMIRYSREALGTGAISADYKRASKSWAIYGTAATLLPIIILYLMISQSI